MWHGMRATFAATLLAAAVAPAETTDQPVFGKQLLIRTPPFNPAANLVVYLGRDPNLLVDRTEGAGDPTCGAEDGGGASSLRIVASGAGGDVTIPLPCGGWRTNAARSIFKYTDPTGGTCKLVLVKHGRLTKAVCRGPQVDIEISVDIDPVTVVTTLNSQRYCSRFGGTIVRDGGDTVLFTSRDAVAPPDCVTAPTTTTVTTSTTTTTTFGTLVITTTAGSTNCGPAGLTTNPAPPFSGEVDSDTGGTTKIRDLGLGCRYAGAGNQTLIPAARIPDGAATRLMLGAGTMLLPSEGSGPNDCSKGAGPARHCVNNNAMPACTNDAGCGNAAGACALDANCFFGPPLAVLSPPPFGSLTTCVVTVIASDASGTVDRSTGEANVSVPLSARVYITGNTGSPCPRCAPTCNYGRSAGATCAAVGSLQTSNDCLPSLLGFQVDLPIEPLALSTSTMTLTEPDGNFCPDQLNPGAFGILEARRIAESGSPAGDLRDGLPHAAVLAGVTCLPASGSAFIDGTADLPGPLALGLNATLELQ